MALVLGIDGGGTKTACAIARDGRVLSEVVAGPSNLVRFPDDQVRTNLHGAINQACEAAGVQVEEIEAASLGLAGAFREVISNRAQGLAKEVLSCPVEVVGDVIVALDAAVQGGSGLIVIAGTGSIALGRNDRGDIARAGGWGSAISDEGSGYWIGRRAVSAAFHAFDGGRSSSLMRHIMTAWQVSSRDELILRSNSQPQPNFSELAPAVMHAAHEGDPVALEILSEAGTELAKLAKIVIGRLWPGSQRVDVYTVGGIFHNANVVRHAFENSIRADRPETQVKASSAEPIHGALIRAEALAAKTRK